MTWSGCLSWFWTDAAGGLISLPQIRSGPHTCSSTAQIPVERRRNARILTRLPHLSGLLVVVLLAVGLGAFSPAAAQPDSTRRAILEAKGLPADHTPRGALWRALAAPSWGQIYNRQYYKVPFALAGLAGFGAAIVYSNNQYLLYRRAALFKGSEDATPNPYAQYEPQYRQIENDVGGEVRASLLREERDKFRRYRDLSVVGVGLYYAFTVLDAYVSAQLLSFDVGEDLSMRVHPAQGGIATQLRWRF